MAFFKPIYKKMSKKWHPQAVSVGKPIEMDELCKQIALISTVSSADSKATLEALGLVLGSSMNTGRTVHVEGLGTFYYTCVSNGKGVDSAEKVNANQISGTRVRFIPRVAPPRQCRHPRPHRRECDVDQRQFHQWS